MKNYKLRTAHGLLETTISQEEMQYLCTYHNSFISMAIPEVASLSLSELTEKEYYQISGKKLDRYLLYGSAEKIEDIIKHTPLGRIIVFEMIHEIRRQAMLEGEHWYTYRYVNIIKMLIGNDYFNDEVIKKMVQGLFDEPVATNSLYYSVLNDDIVIPLTSQQAINIFSTCSCFTRELVDYIKQFNNVDTLLLSHVLQYTMPLTNNAKTIISVISMVYDEINKYLKSGEIVADLEGISMLIKNNNKYPYYTYSKVIDSVITIASGENNEDFLFKIVHILQDNDISIPNAFLKEAPWGLIEEILEDGAEDIRLEPLILMYRIENDKEINIKTILEQCDDYDLARLLSYANIRLGEQDKKYQCKTKLSDWVKTLEQL